MDQVTKLVCRRCQLDARRVFQARQMFTESEPPCPYQLHSLVVLLSVLLPLLFSLTSGAEMTPPCCLLCQSWHCLSCDKARGLGVGPVGGGPCHSPSSCSWPALCTSQVRRTDPSFVLRVSFGVSIAAMQPDPLAKGHQVPHRVATGIGRKHLLGSPMGAALTCPQSLQRGAAFWAWVSC